MPQANTIPSEELPTEAMMLVGWAVWTRAKHAGEDEYDRFRLGLAAVLAMEATRPTTPAAVIHANGPNSPAMMLCAKLAECGALVKIEAMEKALSLLVRPTTPEQPSDALREAAAKAICERRGYVWENDPRHKRYRQPWLDDADAAIAAMQASIGEG